MTERSETFDEPALRESEEAVAEPVAPDDLRLIAVDNDVPATDLIRRLSAVGLRLTLDQGGMFRLQVKGRFVAADELTTQLR